MDYFWHVNQLLMWRGVPRCVYPGSLCCETADEAKTLIPSLADKIKDDELQDLLGEIMNLQNR
jgi:hypothetical protein